MSTLKFIKNNIKGDKKLYEVTDSLLGYDYTITETYFNNIVCTSYAKAMGVIFRTSWCDAQYIHNEIELASARLIFGEL